MYRKLLGRCLVNKKIILCRRGNAARAAVRLRPPNGRSPDIEDEVHIV